jgi:hypothetical protein
MATVMESLTDFKLRLGKEWLMLQTHKYRRPKWIKLPRSMHDDSRWLRLRPEAKAAWIDIMLIASENENSVLPEPDILFRKLKILGHCRKKTFYSSLIHELIQCGFLLKTTPELQSYRVKHTSHRKDESGVVDFKERKQRKERGSAEEVMAESKGGEARRPHSSFFLRVREAGRACWGDRAAGLIGAAYYNNGISEEQILEAMQSVVASSGDVDELAHDLWKLAA